MFRWQFPHRKKRELQNSQDPNKTNSSKFFMGVLSQRKHLVLGLLSRTCVHTAEMSPTGAREAAKAELAT